jgi:hypothetical protein
MQKTLNFKGRYEGGHDQHFGNVYNGPVYIGDSTRRKRTYSSAESGNLKKLPPEPDDDENRNPSLEGMICIKSQTDQDADLDRIPCLTQISRILRARRQHHGQSGRYLQLALAL